MKMYDKTTIAALKEVIDQVQLSIGSQEFEENAERFILAKKELTAGGKISDSTIDLCRKTIDQIQITVGDTRFEETARHFITIKNEIFPRN